MRVTAIGAAKATSQLPRAGSARGWLEPLCGYVLDVLLSQRGRGLAIVDDLAQAWGVIAHDDALTSVWAVVSTIPAAAG